MTHSHPIEAVGLWVDDQEQSHCYGSLPCICKGSRRILVHAVVVAPGIHARAVLVGEQNGLLLQVHNTDAHHAGAWRPNGAATLHIDEACMGLGKVLLMLVSNTIICWTASLVLQVMSKELQEQGYYKKKGTIVAVKSPYVGEIEMADSGDVLRVDQAQLETVLPAPGGQVMVVVGKHRGQRGAMLGVHAEDFQAEVELTDGTKLLLEYEAVCKLA